MVESYALVVPLRSGQAAREFVASRGIGRADLKLGRREGHLLIPIREAVDAPFPGARIERADFEEAKVAGSYKDRLRLPEALQRVLPSSYDIVGDLVVIKIPAGLRAHAKEIGQAILDSHPSVKGVFHDAGVAGQARVRRLEPLAGETRTQTAHTEYGARFHVDLAGVYFSPRLANEHKRVADAVQPGEVLVDATCGVGPFAILAARRRVAARIHAIDNNPRAEELLRANLEENGVAAGVDIHLGDAAEVLHTLPGFDRCVINLPHSGQAILDAAWALIRPGGTIHYHTIAKVDSIQATGKELARHAGQRALRPGELVFFAEVHPYSPTDRLVAYDFALR